MKAEAFTVDRDRQRAELAADLARGGYVLNQEGASVRRYFEKDLVLTRPGLLNRAGRLMGDLIPVECERLAITGVSACTIGTALSQESGIPLLLGKDDGGTIVFGGEPFAYVKAILVEDVVDSGRRALLGARALAAAGAEVLGVLALLDRQRGAAQRLAENGFNLRELFTERDLTAPTSSGQLQRDDEPSA